MEYRLITALEEFDTLAEEWNRLLPASITDTPFLRHEYLRAWLSGLGGGEWPNGELRLVGAWQDGRLQAAAPFLATAGARGEDLLVLLGGIEISDRLDLLCPPGELEQFIPGLLTTLEELSPARVELYNLPDDSPSLAALEAGCQRRGWAYIQEPFRPSLAAPLPGDWEAYLAGIDKKQRHEIRRKMRRAEESGRGVRWYTVEDEGTLEGAMEAFLGLMSTDAGKARFLTPAMRMQMQAIARAAFNAGWLQLAFLEIDGQKACGYLNFDFGNRVWVYNSGLDPRFMELSPGWVLLGHLLQWANLHGRSAFDFMRGDEDYKLKFGGKRQDVVRVTLQRLPGP